MCVSCRVYRSRTRHAQRAPQTSIYCVPSTSTIAHLGESICSDPSSIELRCYDPYMDSVVIGSTLVTDAPPIFGSFCGAKVAQKDTVNRTVNANDDFWRRRHGNFRLSSIASSVQFTELMQRCKTRNELTRHCKERFESAVRRSAPSRAYLWPLILLLFFTQLFAQSHAIILSGAPDSYAR
uniref:Uncharacterized protein n=1 Tax=Ascaris lumbricoides TaxID=6252 RepID=A0A0M3IDL5_ASCLU